MSGGLKRKARELGEQSLSAAVGEVAARTVSAAVGRYDAQATVDDQLEHLARLLITVHSAVEAAERVHIRGWWLRRWLWRLRDAAADGDEVLRSFRQRPVTEEANSHTHTQQAVSTLWNAARRVLRSAKTMLMLAVAGDEDVERLTSTVARLRSESPRASATSSS
ncbi:hypothetical protein PR202_ga28611 [Eleusine coracana subsp. coracana]|uniref:Disease resistance N-terminal domain-containing protein n=1 Tax=Eleusine coracana subsp. coracana TaxID=191504 RepID=A0AAV5DK72_ELECO|nr:hypothetical protein PR202_ga28611 [Eleusine coracana subsp. coracana]